MRPPKPNSVEPPWYGTRMPGGVGGVASRGVPLSRSHVNSGRLRRTDALLVQMGRNALSGPGGVARVEAFGA